ncbi:MAG: hypothetical protein ACI4JN_08835 [Ruminococcus sp.]
MKKRIWIWAVIFCFVFASGCSKNEEPQTEKQTLAVNGSAENSQTYETDTSKAEENEITTETTAASAETATESPAAENENIHEQSQTEFQQNTSGGGQNGSSGNDSVNYSGNDSVNAGGSGSADIVPEQTQPAEGIFGAEGKTESEWLAAAQQMYRDGCDMAFRYLCTGSEFVFDVKNLEIIDKTYFLTTCASFDEATKQYYELFSREYHANDFDGLLLEQNGRLYAARGARGMDMTYLSSEVEKLVSVSENEIVFSVLVEYESGAEEMEFSLVPEDDVWKIGRFTLPY